MLSTLLEWLLVCSPFLVYAIWRHRQLRTLRLQLVALRKLVNPASVQSLTVGGDVYTIEVIETTAGLLAHEIPLMERAKSLRYKEQVGDMRARHLAKLDRLARGKLTMLIEEEEQLLGLRGIHLKMRSVVAIPHTGDLESWSEQSLPSSSAPPAA